MDLRIKGADKVARDVYREIESMVLAVWHEPEAQQKLAQWLPAPKLIRRLATRTLHRRFPDAPQVVKNAWGREIKRLYAEGVRQREKRRSERDKARSEWRSRVGLA